MFEQQLVLFDYNNLDLETRVIVQQRTSEIKSLMKRAAQDIIEIGQKLIEVKTKLRHGAFGDWLKLEFDWSDNTAHRFIQVAKSFGQIPQIGDFAPSALYLLAENSTPEFAREEAIARADSGEAITYSTAKTIVEFHKSNIELEQPEVLTYDDWISSAPRPQDIIPISFPTVPPPPGQSQPMGLLAQSLNDSWRTPERYIEAARQVLGQIDLDPASSVIANETIKAGKFFTKEDNGLDQPWFGNVWINPPYGKTNNLSNQGLFAQKLILDYHAGRVKQGIILVNLYSGYGWFAPLRVLPMCMVDHRISFIDPTTDQEGDEAKASSVFIYVGKDPARFYRIFKQFGPCSQPSYEWF